MKIKTQYEIDMEYKKAMELADRLRVIGGKIAGLANENLSRALNSVRNNWEGENAEDFLVKGDLMKQKVSSTASEIIKTADAIYGIAEIWRNKELKAIQIASEK